MPVAAGGVSGVHDVDMLVATTRALDPSPNVLFSGERGFATSFADIDVSLPPDQSRAIGQVQWPAQLPGDPATDFVTRRAAIIDRQTAMDWVHRKAFGAPGKQVLVFVHGFNTGFDDAVYRFAQIVHDSGTAAVPVLFTWPSKGDILAYGYDHDSTTYSRTDLETVLKDLTRDPQVSEVSILAHSMGNWLVLEALRQMAIRNGRVDPKIKNVLLAAADVDVDVARKQVLDMGPMRPRFSLFISRSDKALDVSKNIWGSTDRLGSIDAMQEPYRSVFEHDKIAVFDLTALQSDPLNHTTFATSPAIVQLIGSRLAAGQSVDGANPHFTDQVITSATGAVASLKNRL